MKRPRIYNVLFDTHTISGIIISVVLFIVFFAGAFSFFREEIAIWERPQSIPKKDISVDFDAILKKLDTDYFLTGRDISLKYYPKKNELAVYLQPSKIKSDSIVNKAKKSHYFILNTLDYTTKSYAQNYGLSEFLYRLHFLHQIPVVGIYISGFTAFFLLFAIITGIVVYWKKIVSNFYNFNPKATLKRVWADAHTALGVIGLPFQLIYAVTGFYFGLSILILLPASMVYKNDREKLMTDLYPYKENIAWQQTIKKEVSSFNIFTLEVKNKYKNTILERAIIKNYNGTTMNYNWLGRVGTKQAFTGTFIMRYDATSNTLQTQKSPYIADYVQDIQAVVKRLHFGDFGGFWIKIIGFVFAIITCFVIISGVLIWVESRNKKSKTLKQRRYSAKVGYIYMAICMAMLPVTAFCFVVVKYLHGIGYMQQSTMYYLYFGAWFLLSFMFYVLKDNYKVTKISLGLSAFLGFLIPVVNAILTKQWPWQWYAMDKAVFMIDMLWIHIGIICLGSFVKTTPKVKQQSSFNKLPLK